MSRQALTPAESGDNRGAGSLARRAAGSLARAALGENITIPLAALWCLLLAGCVTYDMADARHVVFHHPNGQVAAEGHFSSHESHRYTLAVVEKRDPAPWTEYFRVGQWRYWHPNGVLRAEITYAVASYSECCVAGPCPGAYERIVGRPRVFDANGAPVTLERASRYASIPTNCDVGDQVFRPSYILPEDLAPEWSPHEPFRR